jgi:lysophospholipase-3
MEESLLLSSQAVSKLVYVCVYFRAIDYPVGWEMRKDVERYSVEFQAPDVEVHCLHGYGVDTINR